MIGGAGSWSQLPGVKKVKAHALKVLGVTSDEREAVLKRRGSDQGIHLGHRIGHVQAPAVVIVIVIVIVTVTVAISNAYGGEESFVVPVTAVSLRW